MMSVTQNEDNKPTRPNPWAGVSLLLALGSIVLFFTGIEQVLLWDEKIIICLFLIIVLITSLVSIITGLITLKRIKQDNQVTGKAYATIGIIIGILMGLLSISMYLLKIIYVK